jgi:hypothetical protein
METNYDSYRRYLNNLADKCETFRDLSKFRLYQATKREEKKEARRKKANHYKSVSMGAAATSAPFTPELIQIIEKFYKAFN